MSKIEDYHILKTGDLVRMVGQDMGIVTEIQEHGQVQVFWPSTNKVSIHGKKWAELHLEIIHEY